MGGPLGDFGPDFGPDFSQSAPPVQAPPNLSISVDSFPPSAPNYLLNVTPSYLYAQYKDDDALQAFVSSYNAMAQQYIDTFTQLNLAIYTSPLISGSLLDWVGSGLYGIARPSLSSGRNRNIGAYGTFAYNAPEMPYNGHILVGPKNISVTSDDTYKRILTWHIFKGDGKIFNTIWLKRRIARFLSAPNGTSTITVPLWRISVSFGAAGQVAIWLINSVSSINFLTTYNGGNPYNGRRTLPNTITKKALPYNANGFSTNTPYPTPFPYTLLFQQAINSGALELPFQFQYTVQIS